MGKKSLPSIREVFFEVRREESRHKVMLKSKVECEVESSALVSKGTDLDGDRSLGVNTVKSRGTQRTRARNYMGNLRISRRKWR